MQHQSVIRGIGLAAAVWIILGLLRFKPWQRVEGATRGRETIQVGFLPVT